MNAEALRSKLLEFTRKHMLFWKKVAQLYDPEDIVHDVLIKAASTRQTPNDPDEKLKYLKQCVRNRIVDITRSSDYKSTSRFDPLEKTIMDALSKSTSGAMPYEHPDWNSVTRAISLKIAGELAAIRKELTRMQHTHVIDFFAVLLVEARLVFASRLLRTEGLIADIPEGSASDLIEQIVPWSQEDTKRTFKKGFPEIHTIWERLKSKIDTPGSKIHVNVLCDAVNELKDQGKNQLIPNVWYAWTKRARDMLLTSSFQVELFSSRNIKP